MDFEDFTNPPPFETPDFLDLPDNQLGLSPDNELFPEYDYSLSNDSNPSFDSMTLGTDSDSVKEMENAHTLPPPEETMHRTINFQDLKSVPQRRSVTTRHRLRLGRIPPPPVNFRNVEPPFLPPPVHSDFYPFDGLNDAKTFIAHNNDKTEKTWVCVPLNFINRFRNDRLNEQRLYGYLIKTD